MSIPTIEWGGWRISTVTLAVIVLLVLSSTRAAWIFSASVAGRENRAGRVGCLVLVIVAWLLGLLFLLVGIVRGIGIAV